MRLKKRPKRINNNMDTSIPTKFPKNLETAKVGVSAQNVSVLSVPNDEEEVLDPLTKYLLGCGNARTYKRKKMYTTVGVVNVDANEDNWSQSKNKPMTVDEFLLQENVVERKKGAKRIGRKKARESEAEAEMPGPSSRMTMAANKRARQSVEAEMPGPSSGSGMTMATTDARQSTEAEMPGRCGKCCSAMATRRARRIQKAEMPGPSSGSGMERAAK